MVREREGNEKVIHEYDNVFPMVPAGEAISKAFDETDLKKNE